MGSRCLPFGRGRQRLAPIATDSDLYRTTTAGSKAAKDQRGWFMDGRMKSMDCHVS
jgi:hypothetical protein